MDYFTIAKISNELRKFISDRWYQTAELRSRQIFRTEFKANKLTHRQQRDANRIWKHMAEFVCEEISNRMDNNWPPDFNFSHLELALEILKDLLINNSVSVELISSYVDRPLIILDQIVKKEISRRHLMDSEAATTRLVIGAFFEIISQMYLHVPVFQAEKNGIELQRLVTIISSLEEVHNALSRLSDSLNDKSSSSAHEYERIYRLFLDHTLSSLQVVGLKAAGDIFESTLSVGYVDLDVNFQGI